MSADIEAGYASTAKGVAETVEMVIAAGAVGANIEDSTGIENEPLLSIEQYIERLQAAREAANRTLSPFVINARTDIYLFNIGDKSHSTP